MREDATRHLDAKKGRAEQSRQEKLATCACSFGLGHALAVVVVPEQRVFEPVAAVRVPVMAVATAPGMGMPMTAASSSTMGMAVCVWVAGIALALPSVVDGS